LCLSGVVFPARKEFTADFRIKQMHIRSVCSLGLPAFGEL